MHAADGGAGVRAGPSRARAGARVRQAARDWHAAGAIDGPTLARIEERHPDDRSRAGPCSACCSLIVREPGHLAALAAFLVIVDPGRQVARTALIAFGAGLGLLTELQTDACAPEAQGGIRPRPASSRSCSRRSRWRLPSPTCASCGSLGSWHAVRGRRLALGLRAFGGGVAAAAYSPAAGARQRRPLDWIVAAAS